jgi:hypothetical protein
MREICQYGSEGGAAREGRPYPYQEGRLLRRPVGDPESEMRLGDALAQHGGNEGRISHCSDQEILGVA